MRSALGAVAVMLALVGTVVAQTPTALTVLRNGGRYDDTLDRAVSARLYAFQAHRDREITISMDNVTNDERQPFMVLLGPRGEVYRSSTTNADPTRISRFASPAFGNYYLLATTSAYLTMDRPAQLGEVVGPFEYELVADGIGISARELALELYLTEITYGETRNGESTILEPVFYYALKAKAGDTFDVTLSSHQFDTLLYLFDPLGDRVAMSNDIAAADTNSAIGGYEADRDGQYLIFATDAHFYTVTDDAFSEDPYVGGVFEISVSLVEDDDA